MNNASPANILDDLIPNYPIKYLETINEIINAIYVKTKAIAGMKEIYAGVHNGKYVIIYAWDKAECKELEGVIMTMSETAQKAVKEAKDLESRMTAPAGTPQPPVRVNNGKGSKRRGAPAIQEGGSASDDAGDYL